ncbi:hypothetical protein V8G54_019425, partial [Vigna mungo]
DRSTSTTLTLFPSSITPNSLIAISITHSFFSSTILRSSTALTLASLKFPIFAPKSSPTTHYSALYPHESSESHTCGANTPTPSPPKWRCQTSSPNTSALDTVGLAMCPANSSSASSRKPKSASEGAGPNKNRATK